MPTSPMELNSGILLTLAMEVLTVGASVLTILASWLLLWLYQRTVGKLMSISAGGAKNGRKTTRRPGPPAEGDGVTALPKPNSQHLYSLIQGRPWQCAGRYAMAGLLFSLVMASACLAALSQPQINPLGAAVSPWRFLFLLCMFAWPIVMATNIVAASSGWMRWGLVGLYFVLLAACIGLATLIPSEAADHWGVGTPAWSGETPIRSVSHWIIFNLPPTLLLLAFRNRRIRAVAPLVLSFMTVISGGLVSLLAVMMINDQATMALLVPILEFAAHSLGIDTFWAMIGMIVLGGALSIGALGWLGWQLLLWLGTCYQDKRISDQSLSLDALWLTFAAYYSMILVLSGPGWILSAAVAFLIYKAALRFLHKRGLPEVDAGAAVPTLLVLRVFSLGKRSEILFEAVAKRWRYIGDVRLITGTDLAKTIVAPHQFLSFLGGKLKQLFVDDDSVIARRMGELDTCPDGDGRFRINDIYCHSDTWQRVLAQLIGSTDTVVLMDLRSFSASSRGCIFELNELMNAVPLHRLVFVVDASTDMAFLNETVENICQTLRFDSPNLGISPALVQPLPLKSLRACELERLIWRLLFASGEREMLMDQRFEAPAFPV